jgi:hypothetical protein
MGRVLPVLQGSCVVSQLVCFWTWKGRSCFKESHIELKYCVVDNLFHLVDPKQLYESHLMNVVLVVFCEWH